MKRITINNDLFNNFPAVQHERAPKMSGVTSSTHGLSYAANLYAARHQEGIFPFQMHFSTPVSFPLDNYYMPSPYYPHLTESLNLKFNQTAYKPPQLLSTSSYDLEIGKMLTSNLMSRVPTEKTTKEKENEVTSSEEVPVSDSTRMKSTQSLYDSATKLLFLSIRWAKSIPSFNQLPQAAQKRLLNECWAELFVIAASQWGLSLDDDILANSAFLRLFQGVIKHFGALKIDHFEAACLKALILFRCDTGEDPMTSQQISLLQNQTICLLIEKSGGLRFGHLLLLLPQIRVAGHVQSLQVNLNISLALKILMTFVHFQENLFKHTIGEMFIEKVFEDL